MSQKKSLSYNVTKEDFPVIFSTSHVGIIVGTDNGTDEGKELEDTEGATDGSY